MNELKDKVLERIQTGEIAMRPRWHFILQTVALVSGSLVLLLSAMYVISFIVFSLKRTGLLLAPSFGWAGVSTLIMFSPWLLITLVFVFFISMEILVRKYSFGYRHPLLYSVFGIVLVSFAGAVAILHIPIHEALEHGKMTAPLYERYAGHRPDGMYIGRLVSIEGKAFVFGPEDGEEFIVYVTDRTKLPPASELEIGELFMVFGRVTDDTVEALGIRPIEIGVPLLHENRPPRRLHQPLDMTDEEPALFGTFSF